MGKSMNDVVVVGGGLGGLTTAALLARRGLRVALVERAQTLGGRGATREHGGYFFNQGAHALYLGGAAMRVLRSLGVEPRGRKPPASGIAVAHGTTHALPSTFGATLTTGLLSLSAKFQGAKLFAGLGSFDTKALANVSWSDFAAREIADPGMRETLEAFVRVSTYANAPDSVSAGKTIDQLRLAQKPGVLYVDRGWQSLVDGVAKIATDHRVEMHLGERADHVSREGDQWTVSIKEGETLRCKSLVLATGPLTARSLVASKTLQDAAARAVPARIACLDVALERLPNERATFALGIDRPVYLSVHSNSARVAPSGSALVATMKYLSPNEAPDPRADRAELASLLDLLQPGWRELLVDEQWLPSVIATNAIPLANDRERISSQISDAIDLFVVGDWVGDEGMLLDAALASAEAAAARITSTSTVAKVA